ncbi:hypothetical protein NDU88_006303 [Pleurodeles waltl]|uniref:Uncharacterized protein n=1 Tax=Pleurodeles waltl TaxID=8319 RepID=A0AAV7TF79_PLEWA|nr:hypothetical protein NDU88_006303 [Pleurodeles waltl]
MMRILIKHSEKKTSKLQAEVDKLEKSIDDMNLKDAIKRNNEILDKVMDEDQISLHDKKLRKIKRDQIDHREGRIYMFAWKYVNLKTAVASKRTRIETLDTDSASSSSVGSFESTTSSAASTSAPPVHNPSPFFSGDGKVKIRKQICTKRKSGKTKRGGLKADVKAGLGLLPLPTGTDMADPLLYGVSGY